jgi:hypothetical protein
MLMFDQSKAVSALHHAATGISVPHMYRRMLHFLQSKFGYRPIQSYSGYCIHTEQLGRTVANQGYLQKQINSRLSSGHTYRSVNIKIHKTCNFTYCSPMLKEEHRLKVFGNRVLRRLLGRGGIRSVFGSTDIYGV